MLVLHRQLKQDVAGNTNTHTVRCKVSALAGEGVGDAADRLDALAQLAHIPYADAVVTAGCSQQMLLTWLNLHHTTICMQSCIIPCSQRYS